MSAAVTTFWQQSHFQSEFHKRKTPDTESDMRKRACQERAPFQTREQGPFQTREQAQERCQMTKRLAELSLNEQLMKRMRCSQPTYKSAKASKAFERNQKTMYTKQEVEQLLKHVNDIHRAELDEQYATFQTIVTDFIQCSDGMKSAPSYIS